MYPSVKVFKFDDVLFFMIRTNCPNKFISIQCLLDAEKISLMKQVIIENFNAQITLSNNLGIKTYYLGTSIVAKLTF